MTDLELQWTIYNCILLVTFMIRVVAALIKKDNKVLIAKRLTGDSSLIGKWEFPGGKVEKNEDDKRAIEREIREEFNIKIVANKFLANSIHDYPNKKINLCLYDCDYIDGTFSLHDHSEYKYVSKEELNNYTFCPADIPLVEFIIRLEKTK